MTELPQPLIDDIAEGSELQLPFHAGLFAANVVKMHGDMRHEEHFVITRRDYDTFLETYPVVATHLSAMLIVRTALFLAGKELRRSEPEAFEEVPSSTLDRPIGRGPESIYWELIKPAAEAVGLTPLRADQITDPGKIMEQIRAAIRESRTCIADISSANANVLYELGLAWQISPTPS